MKLFDFVRRAAVPPPKGDEPTTEPRPPLKGQTPEDIIDADWEFRPLFIGANGAPVYERDTIVSLCAIHIARSLERIADDVEAIRKHTTRLQLVRDTDDTERD